MAPVSALAQAPAPSTATAGATARPSKQLPRVMLVATGGTISNRDGGRLAAEELVAAVPELSGVAAAQVEQFSNTTSARLTLEQWVQLSRRLSAVLRDDTALAGVVVTSGTDTLEELAYFLHLTVRDRRPVVVTGSMRTPSQPGYEGAANLLAAFRVAADPAAAGRGVLVVLNDEINGARDVTKSDALRLHTFVSRGAGRLGVVDDDRVIFHRATEERHTAASEFDVTRITALPRVDVFLAYQGAAGDLIRAAVDLGASGIVMASAGAGATSGTQDEGLAYARARGVPVVVTTRAGSGRISAARVTQTQDIAGADLSPVKARVLLMLALTKTSATAELQRIFQEY